MKSLIILFPFIVFGGFQELPKSYEYEDSIIIQKNVAGRKFNVRRNKGENKNLEKLLLKVREDDQKIELLLKAREKNLIVRKGKDRILALSRIKGVVLNSILAMNIKASTFVVRIDEGEDLLGGAELRCLGISFGKRVSSHCDLLVTEEREFKIDVQIWGMDGAEGIIADYFYSGEEKSFLTSSLSSFFEGVIDVAKDRIMTPFGEATRDNGKNKILGGLSGISKNANKKIQESGDKKIEISFVNAGKKVILFFNKGINLSKERK